MTISQQQLLAAADDEPISAESAAAQTVEALARSLELHDYRRGLYAETEAHGSRVTRLALGLAEVAAPDLAADPRLRFGFRLHDIGMLGVSDLILRKQGRLTREEVAEVREHPLLGERIVAPVAYLGGLARQVIGAHHEKWAGTGYPRHLSGTQIPLAARIFALADAYDAMTSDQIYRHALPQHVALDEIEQGAGVHFDPSLVPLFVDLIQHEG